MVCPYDKFAGAQGLQDTNTEMLYPSLTYAVSILHRPLQLAENRRAKNAEQKSTACILHPSFR